jgi:hypothetical protein
MYQCTLSLEVTLVTKIERSSNFAAAKNNEGEKFYFQNCVVVLEKRIGRSLKLMYAKRLLCDAEFLQINPVAWQRLGHRVSCDEIQRSGVNILQHLTKDKSQNFMIIGMV